MAKKKKKSAGSGTSRILVRATRIGIYNSRRRYPRDHGHKDSGKAFYLIERKRVSRLTGEVTVLTPEEQLEKANWLERVDEHGLRLEVEEAAAKAREEEIEIEEEADQTGVAAPPGPGDEGEVRSLPSTLGEIKKRESRASDEEVI